MADIDDRSGTGFTLPLAISFKHCDPAGMVFYPRYVEMLNDVIEAWFDRGLGCDYQELHLQRRIAIPTVSLNCEFSRPSRLGDRLLARLDVERIGGSSVSLLHRLADRNDGGDVRLTARQVIVFVDMASTRPIAVPPDILAALGTFLLPTGSRHD
jgi:4-hydroxybenzoyl-CoA thioesterase